MRHYKMLLATLTLLLSATMGWGQKIIFSEDFNSLETTTSGALYTGGNDNQWKGTVAKSTLSSFKDFELGKAYCAYQCIKLGIASQKGWIQLPLLNDLSDGCKLTFRAGAWNDNAEHLKVKVVVGSFEQEVSIKRAEFTNCSVELHNIKAGDRIKITSVQDSKNRFFLDDIVVTAPGETPPPSQPNNPVVLQSLEQLRQQQAGNVWLTFVKDKPAQVSFIHGSNDVYVADKTGFVRFHNFLSNNKGWHLGIDGQLVGTVFAHYEMKDGLPTLTSVPETDVRTVLCLTGSGSGKARLTTIEDLEKNKGRAAELVEVKGFTITKESDKYVAKQNGKQIFLLDYFGKKDLERLGVTGHKRFQMTAIVAETNSSTVLYPITLKEEIEHVTLEDTKDCQSVLNTHDACTASVRIQRQLLANMWNTLCLPFDVEDVTMLFGDETNIQVAELKSYDAQSGTLQFETVQHMEAGKPYLVKVNRTIESIEVTNIILKSKLIPTTVSEEVVFQGNFSPKPFETGDRQHIFLGKNNKLYYPSNNHPLRAFRAYFESKGTSLSVQRFSVGDKHYDITAIKALSTDEVLANEQLYDLDGRIISRQKKTQDGLYITRGGKKIIE